MVCCCLLLLSAAMTTDEDWQQLLQPLDPEEDDYCQHKIRSAKRAARSELSVTRGEWAKHGYAASDILSTDGITDAVSRVHVSDLTLEQFVSQYEAPRVPVVLTGLTDAWPAQQEWTPRRLLEQYKEHRFKVGSDDDGYPVRMRFDHFLRYCSVYPHHAAADDSPLYIFDGTYGDRTASKSILEQYSVPQLFPEDIFGLVGERRRPPYRWFVMGPARSGTGLHVDPLATSAWNALLYGHKRWALFPPDTPKELLLPKEPKVEREAVSWFSTIYPRTQQPGWPAAKPLDIIQRPGEAVFVPHGWWHAVLNLDLTIAVTHNYVSSTNFAAAWQRARKGRPKMSAKLLAALQQKRPDLAAKVDAAVAAGGAAGKGGANNSSSSSSSNSSSSSSSSRSSSSSSSDEEDFKRRKERQQDKRQKVDAEVTAHVQQQQQQPQQQQPPQQQQQGQDDPCCSKDQSQLQQPEQTAAAAAGCGPGSAAAAADGGLMAGQQQGQHRQGVPCL